MADDEMSLIIVEDEPLISMMIEEIVIALGWTVHGLAYTEADALLLLDSCSPKLAVLDINLGIETSLQVAARCRDRHIPYVFATGYTARDLPAECLGVPILPKPFSPDDVKRALDRALMPPMSPHIVPAHC